MHYRGKLRRNWRGAGAIAVLATLVVMAGSCDSSPTEPAEREVLLGGLFSLTGNWSTLGQTSQAAMELAVEDVNQYLGGDAATLRFTAAIEDTRLDPDVALERAQALRARGAQILIGPHSSAEVTRLKPFVDANALLLVSQSSTAGTLAIPGDNVFRFTPADSLEGVAVSALMWDDGIRAIVPVWRDDPGNAGLERATRAGFTTLGGTVLEGVKYGATTEDFAATVTALRAQVEQAIAQQGAGRVAVYLAAFDEVVQLFARAADDPVLGAVRWYGSDGVALSEALLGSAPAVDFAIRVGYPNPIFGLDESAREKWEPVAQRIRTQTNLEPDAFALAVYDAVWVAAQSYLATGASPTIEELTRVFVATAGVHFGATGWTVLNAAGDRRYGDFDFWAVRQVNGTPRWVRVAQYETLAGRLVRR
ncbi:MAG TPA: ABC transporter substrate-binding protein [Longimicrobiaceae bacterium]|nr:ABC transporter substrate-binding protein [Longimicrobiaceae bacterium]